MATFKRFEEIESWKRARKLTNRIYQVSSKEISLEISHSRIRFGVRAFRSCRT
jgi:hypothetical protein